MRLEVHLPDDESTSNMHRRKDLDADVRKRESFWGSVLNITTWEQNVERNGIVKINDYSEADEYTCGYALRVPKIVRFRPYKKIEETDSIEKCIDWMKCSMRSIHFKACDLFHHFHFRLDGEEGRNPTR